MPGRKSGVKILNEEYHARLARHDWRFEICPRINKRAMGFCERCVKKSEALEVHHLTYERFGHELDSDLQALCHPCHKEADAERKKALEREAEACKTDVRFKRWLLRKYGKFGTPPANAEELFEDEDEDEDWEDSDDE